MLVLLCAQIIYDNDTSHKKLFKPTINNDNKFRIFMNKLHALLNVEYINEKNYIYDSNLFMTKMY